MHHRNSFHLKSIFKNLSFLEKVVATVLVILLGISVLIVLIRLNNTFSVEVPEHGGTLTEGIIGAPRFINPVLTLSPADNDLTTLVYAGLMKATPQGDYISDLAESYTISPDGKEYTFILRETATFHDGTPVTADDVVFTIAMIQDSQTKSPKRTSWDNITVEKVDDHTVRFVLQEPYIFFLENTTVGILPQHIWKQVTPEQFGASKYNLAPIGAGPYRLVNTTNDKEGIPKQYILESFENYSLGEPYISKIVINFFSNEEKLFDALLNKSIDAGSGITPEHARLLEAEELHIEQIPITRIFGVFFNQNSQQLFTSKEVRQALSASVDRGALIDQILSGYGTPLSIPLLDAIDVPQPDTLAQEMLENAGWKKDEGGVYTKKDISLSFTLTTSNAPELQQTALALQKMWNTLGANVDLQLFDTGQLNQQAIRPRKYEALLFGYVLGRNADLYPFWHSSQRIDPGLNIALYTNKDVDTLIRSIRTESSPETRARDYTSFANYVTDDMPAVFLYAPELIYVLPEKIRDAQFGRVVLTSDRFLGINTWHMNTENVWSIFVHTSPITASTHQQ